MRFQGKVKNSIKPKMNKIRIKYSTERKTTTNQYRQKKMKPKTNRNYNNNRVNVKTSRI